MAEHTLRGNDTILPSMTRETELLLGLNVLNDRASMNSFPSPSSSSPISITIGKRMSDEDENKDTFLVTIGGSLQGAVVLRTNGLDTGQSDIVDLLEEHENDLKRHVIRALCAAPGGWYVTRALCAAPGGW